MAKAQKVEKLSDLIGRFAGQIRSGAKYHSPKSVLAVGYAEAKQMAKKEQ